MNEKRYKLYLGDNMKSLKELEDNSVDSVVTDPPYALTSIRKRFGKEGSAEAKYGTDGLFQRASAGFMGQEWDAELPSVEFWREVYRVLKPGGHILSFGGSRTFHRCAVNIEDGGFEIRDTITWLYGCLDDKSEILTDSGWKKYTDITLNDKALSWNSDLDILDFNKIDDIIIKPYKGDMVLLKNKHTEQILTPNHRVYHKYERKDRGYLGDKWEVVEAGDMKSSGSYTLPLASYYEGEGIGGEDYAALLGWIWSEGEFDKKGNAIRISQSSVNEPLVDEIKDLIERLDIKYSHYTRERFYNYKHKGRQSYTDNSFYFSTENNINDKIRTDLPNKKLNFDFVKRMTIKEKEAFLDAAHKGDGSKGKEVIYQNDLSQLELLQFMFMTIGKSSYFNLNKMAVNWRNKSTTQLQHKTLNKKVYYEGDVWCIRVKNNAFVARRGDKVFITGNSGFPKSHSIGKAVSKMAGRIGLSCDEVKIKIKELYDRSNKSYGQISKECGFNASGYIKTTSDKPDPWTTTLPTKEKWFVIADVIGCNETEKEEVALLLEKAEMEVVGKKVSGLFNGGESSSVGGNISAEVDITKSTIKEGQEWDGWGTALKPAAEFITLARKPLSEKSIAENVLKWRTGGLNIDGCRVGYANEADEKSSIPGSLNSNQKNSIFGVGEGHIHNTEGRFPANLILECICDEVIKGKKGEPYMYVGKEYNNQELEKDRQIDFLKGSKAEAPNNYNDKGDIHTNPNCPCYIMDEQSGVSKSSKSNKVYQNDASNRVVANSPGGQRSPESTYGDKGGSSRFFYQAKVSKKERNMGLDGFEVELLTSTMKLLLKTDYNNKNFTWLKEDLKTKLVDTDKSQQKDIEEFGAQKKEDKLWSTELFGKIITDQFLTDTKYIIETATNSTTIYQTLNSLIQNNIKKNIQELSGLMVKDIKLVSDVENKNIKTSIILQKKDGYTRNVNLVELEEVWSINVKENKCGHPTLKPVQLMAYLCRLITPPNGVVLDPFMGSGSTGIAALIEGFDFVGMELGEEYFKISEARIKNWEQYKEFVKK